MVHHVVRLKACGLRLDLEGDRLMVSPAHRLDPLSPEEAAHYDPKTVELIRQERADLAAYIRTHRDEIIAVLATGDIWRERRQEYGRLYRQEEGTGQSESPLRGIPRP